MTVFLVLGVLGLVLLLVSLILGEVLDGLFDVLPTDVFSTAVIGGFVSAFGFGAAAADGAGLPLLGTLVVGAVAGAVVGWFAGWLTKVVRSGATDDTPTTSDTVGALGRVISEIPDDGLGTVRVVVGGHTLQLNARADQSVAAGTEVHVTSVLSPTAVAVAPVWDVLP